MEEYNRSLLLVSGGVDSMSLLHFFINNHIDFAILHINHQTRGLENEIEYQAIKEIAINNNITCYYQEYCHKHGNFQAEAREFRYQVATKICKENNYQQIITGHHRDDLIENILMNENKIGSKLIDKRNIRNGVIIYRPLLNFYKNEIYDYAQKYKIKYFEDKSNQNPKYKRNYYRIQIKNMNNDEKEKVIQAEINRVRNFPIVPTKFTVSKFKNYSVEEQPLVLYLWIKDQIKSNISTTLIHNLCNQINGMGTKEFSLPDNYCLVQEYDNLRLEKKQKVDNIIHEKKANIGKNEFNGIIFINTKENVIIKTREPGDKIVNNSFSKKVNRIMIDMKIPKNLRDQWPVVCDEKRNPLYIPKFSKK